MEYHRMEPNDYSEPTKRSDRKRALPVPENQWSVDTPYLKQLKATHRARAREAMRWRAAIFKRPSDGGRLHVCSKSR